MGMGQRYVECVAKLVDRKDFLFVVKSLRLKFNDQQRTKVVLFVRRRPGPDLVWPWVDRLSVVRQGDGLPYPSGDGIH